MKKLLILIISLLSITSVSNASFWDASSLDLYKNIDSWINNLQGKMMDFELKWWQKSKWILNGINKIAKNTDVKICLDESKNITIDKFNKIVNDNSGINTSEIIKLFNEDCSKDKKTTAKLANTYSDLFKIYYQTALSKSNEDSDQIYKLSQIWIYSDWNLEDSWFDLINDIQEIDKIIFADVVDYQGEEVDSIDNTLNNFFKPLNKKIDKLTAPSALISTKDKENTKNKKNTPIQVSPIITNNNPDNTIKTNNTYICANNLDTSWLSNNALKWLLDNIKNNLDWNNMNNNTTWNTVSWNNNSSWDTVSWNDNSDDNNLNWNYEKVTDNSEWPCENFFCIMIDFTTYEYNLFWWWENITIEYLLNRSNKHLAKYAATSLIPAKMWTNEFELWLKDLNLPDIFHLGFQISTKPIPILDIEKQWKKDETEFSAKNMLKQYYKLNWLNYDRRNDLDALARLDANKQNVNNAAWLSIKKVLEKQKENDSIEKERLKKTNTLRKTIEKRVSYWITSTFEEQFTELDKFTVWINNYVLNLKSLINKLDEKPIDY